MKEDLSLDLKLSRARSGLSGYDLAHLLGCNSERISRLEHGKARIKADEIASLSLIYGLDTSRWLYHLTSCAAKKLKNRMVNMPKEPSNWSQHQDNRLDTLNNLSHRIGILNKGDYEA